MDFKRHLETAWQNTLNFLGPVLLLTLAQLFVIFFSLGVLAPVSMAGYVRSLLRAQREGRPPEIRDLFSTMSLFVPLFIFSVVVMLATWIGFLILVIPGLIVASFILFATMYMLPLMIDQNQGIIAAIKESWAIAIREPITDQIVISLIYLLFMSLGCSIPLALLVTQPFVVFFLLSVYEERLRSRQSLPFEQPAATPPPPPPGQ